MAHHYPPALRYDLSIGFKGSIEPSWPVATSGPILRGLGLVRAGWRRPWRWRWKFASGLARFDPSKVWGLSRAPSFESSHIRCLHGFPVRRVSMASRGYGVRGLAMRSKKRRVWNWADVWTLARFEKTLIWRKARGRLLQKRERWHNRGCSLKIVGTFLKRGFIGQ